MGGFFRSRLFWISLVLVAVASTLPLYVSGYILGLLTVAYYFGVFAMAWDLLFGFAGEVNFGPTFLIGVGAYTAGILNNEYGWSVYLCIVLGALASVVAGFVLALPALRVRGPYFGLTTLVAVLMLQNFVVVFAGLTGGEIGLTIPDVITIDAVKRTIDVELTAAQLRERRRAWRPRRPHRRQADLDHVWKAGNRLAARTADAVAPADARTMRILRRGRGMAIRKGCDASGQRRGVPRTDLSMRAWLTLDRPCRDQQPQDPDRATMRIAAPRGGKHGAFPCAADARQLFTQRLIGLAPRGRARHA